MRQRTSLAAGAAKFISQAMQSSVAGHSLIGLGLLPGGPQGRETTHGRVVGSRAEWPRGGCNSPLLAAVPDYFALVANQAWLLLKALPAACAVSRADLLT